MGAPAVRHSETGPSRRRRSEGDRGGSSASASERCWIRRPGTCSIPDGTSRGGDGAGLRNHVATNARGVDAERFADVLEGEHRGAIAAGEPGHLLAPSARRLVLRQHAHGVVQDRRHQAEVVLGRVAAPVDAPVLHADVVDRVERGPGGLGARRGAPAHRSRTAGCGCGLGRCVHHDLRHSKEDAGAACGRIVGKSRGGCWNSGRLVWPLASRAVAKSHAPGGPYSLLTTPLGRC